jgi:UDP-2-acetamido-3-amino-2,3-dideoxy-glucuronate N-acetyltransferase
MTVLVVGCGRWGRNWVKTLHQMGELGAIVEPSPEIREPLYQQYPGLPIFDNLGEGLYHEGIEAVIVATPVVTHLDVAKACLMAEKHVLVEKPLALKTEEAEQLVSLAAEHHVTLAVGHLLMHHPALLKLRDMIRAGELGDILSVQCTRVNMGKVRNDENAWWSLAPHDISILSLLLEEDFIPYSASRMDLLKRPSLEDTFIATFQTPSGRWGSVHVSWLSPMKKHETIVIGSEKIAVFEDTQPKEHKLALYDYKIERDGDLIEDIRRCDVQYVDYDMPDELLAVEAKAFIAAFREGAPLPNDGQNGLHVVKMLEIVQHQLDAKENVIPITAGL